MSVLCSGDVSIPVDPNKADPKNPEHKFAKAQCEQVLMEEDGRLKVTEMHNDGGELVGVCPCCRTKVRIQDLYAKA